MDAKPLKDQVFPHLPESHLMVQNLRSLVLTTQRFWYKKNVVPILQLNRCKFKKCSKISCVICQECRKKFCSHHRHPDDHKCTIASSNYITTPKKLPKQKNAANSTSKKSNKSKISQKTEPRPTKKHKSLFDRLYLLLRCGKK